MKSIYILLLTVCPCLLFAQFDGGKGDGSEYRRIIQLDLSGIPSGVQALYISGNGDGYHNATAAATLNGMTTNAWYGGGNGDGYHTATSAATLGGVQTGLWCGGGDGDGYHTTTIAATLNGMQTNLWYGGGNGDGYHNATAAATLNGMQTNAWYGGGNGDGYHNTLTTASLSGGMFLLYGGGDGDGYDKNQAQVSLAGINLSRIYGGGIGDGFSNRTYVGVIPLPLSLISFEAIPEATYVLLKWETENEVNTDFFTIEKTKEGIGFDWVRELLAAGNSLSSERLYYEMKDYEPYEGRSYYRLKTTDFDSQVSFSHLVEVNYNSNQDWSFQLFPNPNTGKHLNVKLSDLKEEERLVLTIFDIQGRMVLKKDFRAEDQQVEAIQLEHKLVVGSYLVRLEHPSLGQQSKILIVGGH